MDVTGSGFEAGVRGRFQSRKCDGHTAYEVRAKFALAEVVRSDVSVHRTGNDLRGANVKGLHGITSLLENLNSLTVLSSACLGRQSRAKNASIIPKIPQPDGGIKRACNDGYK